MTICG